jgi:cytochrome c551/c552
MSKYVSKHNIQVNEFMYNKAKKLPVLLKSYIRMSCHSVNDDIYGPNYKQEKHALITSYKRLSLYIRTLS